VVIRCIRRLPSTRSKTWGRVPTAVAFWELWPRRSWTEFGVRDGLTSTRPGGGREVWRALTPNCGYRPIRRVVAGTENGGRARGDGVLAGEVTGDIATLLRGGELVTDDPASGPGPADGDDMGCGSFVGAASGLSVAGPGLSSELGSGAFPESVPKVMTQVRPKNKRNLRS